MTIRFVLPPSRGTRGLTVRAALLAQALSEQLDEDVTVEVAASYADLEQQFVDERADVIWAPPKICARLSHQAQVALTLIRAGRATYRAALVARADDPLTIQSLAGKRAAWVDAHSTAGYLLAMEHLRRCGVAPDKVFASQRFAGSFEQALRAVAEGRADVATVYTATADEAAVRSSLAQLVGQREALLRPFAYTAESPNDRLVLANTLSPERAAALLETLTPQADVSPARALLLELCNAQALVAEDPATARGDEKGRPSMVPAAGAVGTSVLRFDAADTCTACWPPSAATGSAIVGQTLGNLFGDNSAAVACVLEVVRRHEQPQEIELATHQRGATRRVSIEALTDDAPGAVLLVMRDLTEEDAVEQQLVNLASISVLSPDPVVEVTKDGRVAFANRAARTRFPTNAMPPALGLQQAAATMVASVGAAPEDAPARARLGTASYELRSATTDLGRLRIYARDISARERAAAEQKQLEMRLIGADRMAVIGTLAAGVAHEINNPLSYVLANQTMVSDSLAPLRDAAKAAGQDERAAELAEAVEMLDDAADGSRRIAKVVRDLMVHSRASPNAGQREIDVRQLLESTLAVVRNELYHSAELVTELAEVPPVMGNQAELAQVLLNLLLNAAQAIGDGHAKQHQIRLVCRPVEPSRVRIEVHDTGPGIAPEMLPRIFDPFFTTKPVGVGTGTGLSVAKRVVERLGGELSVRTGPGRGCCFVVELPTTHAAPSPSPQPDAAPATEQRRARVLVVDDEPFVARAMRRTLREHEVTLVANGRQAIELLEQGEVFDIIFCDLMMPEITGMEVHEWALRARPAVAERMVFITGGAFSSEAQHFVDRVPNRCIDKPFDPVAVRALVQQHMAAAAAAG